MERPQKQNGPRILASDANFLFLSDAKRELWIG